MAMHVSATIAPDAHYRMEIDAAGHALVADETPALGGADAGPAPFVLVLAGLAACTGITLRMYAERHDQAVGLEISLALELRRDRHLIRREVVVSGGADEAFIARLRDIVERTPVTLALKSGFDVATTLEPQEA